MVDLFIERTNNGGCYVNAKRRSVKREAFVRNWELYLNFPKIFTLNSKIKMDPNGEDGMYCFLCWENGYDVPTREPELVQRAVEGKQSINLQIKMWCEGMWDKQLQCPLFFPQEIREYCKNYPNWVFRAVIEQTKKRVLDDIGFIPTWLKI